MQTLKIKRAFLLKLNKLKSKGSILIEALITVGLIASLTPILYNHVAERTR